jgi:ubiquinone/menaquinone biosynthesis C-methylase UbiE
MSDMQTTSTSGSSPASRVRHPVGTRPASLLILPRTVIRKATGLITGQSDEELYRRSIGLLDIQLEDCVLEVGCGAGIGIEQAAEIAALGKVCGIEPSERLLALAHARNADAIEGGYVELRAGLASRLPWPDASFDKALSVNSPRDWPLPVDNLREIQRVMRPGGKLAIVIQPPWRTPRDEIRDLGELWAHRVDEAGFHDVRYGIITIGRSHAAAIAGLV